VVTTTLSKTPSIARRTSPLVGWGLVVGGAVFFAGGPLHPKEDPPGVSVKEHLRIMFEDPNWYLAHAILLVGTVLIAAALVGLVRGRSLTGVPRVHRAAVVAAVTSCVAAAGTVLHLVAAVDAQRIAEGRSTPITDVQVIVETVSVPAFGFSIAVLAVVGALTRTLGNAVTAVPGVLGGVGYGLAGATFLLTDRLDGLFPTAAGIAVWAFAAGVGLLLRRRAPRRQVRD
jgi:hypothetical protein